MKLSVEIKPSFIDAILFDRTCFRLHRSSFSLYCLIKIELFTRIKTHNVLQLAVSTSTEAQCLFGANGTGSRYIPFRTCTYNPPKKAATYSDMLWNE